MIPILAAVAVSFLVSTPVGLIAGYWLVRRRRP